MAHDHQETKNQCIGKCAKYYDTKLLVHVPIGVYEFNLIPFYDNVGNWAVHGFQNQVLASIVDKHPGPNHRKCDQRGRKPVKQRPFLNTKVVGDLKENKLHLAERVDLFITFKTLRNANIALLGLAVLVRVVVYVI